MPETIFPFDEINKFRQNLHDFHIDKQTGRIKSREDCEDIIDEMLDLFLLAYARGNEVINRQFGGNYEPTIEDVEKTVMLPIEGKTWVDRMWDWYEEGGTEGDIIRIVETEAHRDGNTAAYDTAIANKATFKTWRTMEDDRVREQHFFLDGITVPIDAFFYAPDGSKAQYPGQFGVSEQDCNCRCEVEFS